MSVVKEIAGSGLIGRSVFNHGLMQKMQQKQHQFLAFPALVPSRQSRMKFKRVVRAAMETISEDITKLDILPENPGKLKVRAFVTVRNKQGLKETIVKHWHALTNMIGRNIVLELISTEIHPKTQSPKRSNGAVLEPVAEGNGVHYTAEFTVDKNFGEPGAVRVTNKGQTELFLESITIEGFSCGPVHIPCNSWVQSKKDHPKKRIFFSNKSYLPSETPSGLRALREKELRNLRGDGEGVRKFSDRIYDYDFYNDLGKPDEGFDFARPQLGGQQIPYPRRCRTGRSPSNNDTHAESRVEKPLPIYVPRDDQFEEAKQDAFLLARLKGNLHALLPTIKANLSADNNDFTAFSDIDMMYKEGHPLNGGLQDGTLNKLLLPKVVSKITEFSKALLKYDTPEILSKDKFAWLRDDEFARQVLSGINPGSIEKLNVFPPKSNLDPGIYGSQESALREEHIVGYLNGMSVQKALEENKLFILDYHDIYLPFLDRINGLDGKKSYATRTIFFLTPLGTLKPIAIELCLPSSRLGSQSKRVVTPPVDATTNWIWQLAKAHVCSNDGGVHELINHWLRTHACMEPFILAAHRQLSAMHPIFKLLDPHMRYTLEINALARQSLICTDGIIELCFTPGRYAMEMSAAAYKNFWRFDLEGLPADLIRRGMAIPDSTQPSP